MGPITPHPVEPRRADPETVDWDNVVFEYDQDADIFAFYLFGPQHPAKLLQTRSGIDLLIDPTSQVIVGYQIEGYLARAVYQDPALLAYAEYAGIPAPLIEETRRRIDREWKRALADSFEQTALRIA